MFHFTGENIFGHDQRALMADEIVRVSLSPTSAPADFPDLRSFVRVFDPVALGRLTGERWRVLGDVLHFAGLSVTTTQTRVTARSTDVVFGRFSQYFRL